ncbi:hypothetical protein AB0D29_28280 [Streptomyces sp. NPDC048424]|uniref:hypothetical protein n=1 Tax=Streptomyces sp. NPDC048424 TaxID=3155265 RepID=UPI003413A8EC
MAARSDSAKAAAAGSAVFHSPAERTVRKATTAHGISLASQIGTSVESSIRVEINWGDGQAGTSHTTNAKLLKADHKFAELGTHKVTVTPTDLNNNVTATNSVEVQASGSKFTPHGPTRLLDTRDGTGAAAGPVLPYGTTRVKVGGNSGIPAGATAVALNLTVTKARSGGHVTAYPSRPPGCTTRASGLSCGARTTATCRSATASRGSRATS